MSFRNQAYPGQRFCLEFKDANKNLLLMNSRLARHHACLLVAATASAVISAALALPRLSAIHSEPTVHRESTVLIRAQMGDADAMYQVAMHDCPGQDSSAFFWFELAAKRGNTSAFAASMNVAETLTPEDIAAIRQEEIRWLQCHSSTKEPCPGLPKSVRHKEKNSWMFANPLDNRRASPTA